MQKGPKAEFPIHMSIELEVNVLEEVPQGTRPRIRAKMGKREKVYRAAYGHPAPQSGLRHTLHTQPCVLYGSKPTLLWGCENVGHVLRGPLPTHQVFTGSG